MTIRGGRTARKAPKLRAAPQAFEDDPVWFKDAIFYEVNVRAFQDSNGDGIGDFGGLISRLDYLQDLGVTALWLLPFYESPLKDDGYDISDYTAIHPSCGTLHDFRALLDAAHRRGLRIVTELVLNHTSDQHPWFQRARRAKPGSPARDFYVWSDSAARYADTRIIFKDFEQSNWAWDPVAGAYYWHRFYSHQPDLNWDNPAVRKAMFEVMSFWLDLGVDGMRLDAVPYLYEREGTTCENLPETHQALKELRRRLDEHYPNRMLLAEANQWPEDAVAYFGNGDEVHMAFHFPVMPRLFMSIRMEDRFPIVDILNETPPIPGSCQWAMFLRNHDELTLEMVTDEDRDYMYRVYASDRAARINLGIRRRLAPLLGNDRRKIELMNALLLALPGSPVLYYGDEIGMGDNIFLGDRNGVRTPMQWDANRNAGFSSATPQRCFLPLIFDPEYHYQAVNVESQQNNPHSLLWWIKRMISMRRKHPAMGRGSVKQVEAENRKVLAFVRETPEERVLCVFNLSRFVQYAALPLADFKGLVPVEVFGRTPFPAIGDQPYPMSLGPRSFYWFSLEADAAGPPPALPEALPRLAVKGSWLAALEGRNEAPVERLLPSFLRRFRWFGSKARPMTKVAIDDVIPVPDEEAPERLVIVTASFSDGEPETYVLALRFATGAEAERTLSERPESVLASMTVTPQQPGLAKVEGVLHDCMTDESFASALLDVVAQKRRHRGTKGTLVGSATRRLRELQGAAEGALKPVPVRAEQSNSSVVFGQKLILKIFRRLTEGLNPDLEILRFLTAKKRCSHVPELAGAIELDTRAERQTIGIVTAFVAGSVDAWQFTLDSLDRFLERVLIVERGLEPPGPPHGKDLVTAAMLGMPDHAPEIFGASLAAISLLGQRTGELHVALASDRTDPAFAPEPFELHYQRSIYESMRSQGRRSFQMLRSRAATLPESARDDAQRLLAREEEAVGAFRAILGRRITSARIRCHGDYHLGQVLYTGKDFLIFDFEGEPARPVGERRIKRSPLRDIAGMLRSFDYALAFTLAKGGRGRLRPEDVTTATPWGRSWLQWVSAAFLSAYLQAARGGGFLPKTQEELDLLLPLYVLDKALYELRYELNNRPEWAGVALRGLLDLLSGLRNGA